MADHSRAKHWRIPTDGEPRVNDHCLTRFVETGRPVVELYQPTAIEVVLGAAGRPERDLFVERCRSDGVAIRQRRGGGGAVVLSPGMIVMVVVAEAVAEYDNRRLFSRIHADVIQALAEAGCPGVEEAGVSDLVVAGRKVLGSSMYRHRRLFFYQSALLVENDLSLFGRYLRDPWRPPSYRAGRTHADFCATLREAFGDVDPTRAQEKLQARLRDLPTPL